MRTTTKNTKEHLSIIGEIDWESYEIFSKDLLEIEQKNLIYVEVELASDGGDVHAALAFVSRINKSNCHITIRGTGLVASAAVLILASGDQRYLQDTAWVMVHEETGNMEFSSVSALERESKQMRALETQWNKLLELWTRTTAEAWSKMHKETTHLSAQECLALGLIDKIV